MPEAVAMWISGHEARAVFERYNIVNETDLLEAAKELAAYTCPIAQKENSDSGAAPESPAK